KQWLAFLSELWPQEPEAINVLGEWFGYVVSGRLDLHKILLMIGPTRGGKGLIASVPLASEDSQIGVRMRVCRYGQDRAHPSCS
ncbi:MAG: hypothetical protein WAO13_02510, partial [Pseudolabrys sp.]